MGYMETYKEWIDNPYFDEETKKELQGIEGNEAEIKERSPLIPGACPRNLQMKRHAVWRRMALKLMYLRACARRRSCLLQYGSWAAYQE